MITMRRYLDYFVVGLLCLGSFWFGRLVYENHWSQPEKPEAISMGVPAAIPAKTLAGDALPLDAGSLRRPTLLLVLAADCRYCELNAPQWRGLVASLGGAESAPTVLALSLSDAEETARYLEDNDLEVPVLLIDQAQLSTLGLRGVPGTVALDPGSETMRSWIGVLNESETATILAWAEAS